MNVRDYVSQLFLFPYGSFLAMKSYQVATVFPIIFTIVTLYFIGSMFEFKLYFLSGSLISVTGLVLWFIGKFTLHDSFSALPKANSLVQNGIYSKMRHPIYVGFGIMLVGWMLIFQEWDVFLICLVVLSLIPFRAYDEEKKLINQFGEEYKQYKNNTWF